MKRRIIATVAAALALIILAASFIGVLQLVEIETVTDPADGTVYYSRKEDGVYVLYDKLIGGNPLPTVIENDNKYYVTKKGSLINIDETTGLATDLIPVETEENEAVGFNNRVQIFPHVTGDNILSLEVVNPTDSYKFIRIGHELVKDEKTQKNTYKVDGATGKAIKGNFIIDGSLSTPISQEEFIQLYSAAGYALSVMKIKNPIKNANGEYTEYGLVPEVRERTVVEEKIDETTGKKIEVSVTESYDYQPTYYILTDIDGVRHKMIVGDMLVTGEGYYVQYVDLSDGAEKKRDAVYVVGTSIGCALKNIEYYVEPTLCYPLSMNNYYDVENFVICSRGADDIAGVDLATLYKEIIAFTYIPIEERENTVHAVVPYKFSYGLEGYPPSDSAISTGCLYNLYSPTLVETEKFHPTEEELAEYGFLAKTTDENGKEVYKRFCKYYIQFNYDVLNETNDGIAQTVHQKILISDRDYETTGNYYVYTIVYNVPEGAKSEDDYEIMYSYDMITEVEGHTLGFLKWDEYDWVNPLYIDQNIPYIQSIELSAPNSGFSAVFNLDNSLTDQSSGMSSKYLFINSLVTELGGDGVPVNKTDTSFGLMEVYDISQRVWIITSSGLKVYDTQTGKEISIKKEITYYDYNDMDQQVYCRTGNIGDAANDAVSKIYVNGQEVAGAAGAKVEVTANKVIIHFADGSSDKTYLRYGTELFRKYYETLLYASLIDAYPEEEGDKIIADPSKHMLTMKITIKDHTSGAVTVREYKFYRISSRKAYITLDGNGGFYVYSNRVEKFISDAQKYINHDPTLDPKASR